MTTFKMYIANTNGQKLSGFTNIEAPNLAIARSRYRRQHANKRIDWDSVEVLAAT